MKLIVAKIVMRVIGTLAGVLGLAMLSFGLWAFYSSFSKGHISLLFWAVSAILQLLLSIYFIYIAYLVWFKFSPLAVQHIVGTLAISLFGLISKPLRDISLSNSPWFAFTFLGILVVIYFTYRTASARLSRFLFPELASEKP